MSKKEKIYSMKDYVRDWMEELKFPMLSIKANTGVKIKDMKLFLLGKKTFEEMFSADQVRKLEKLFGLPEGLMFALNHTINRNKQLQNKNKGSK